MYTMTSALIQFRLSGEALEALQVLAEDGESLNLAAQRLMKQLLLGSPVTPASTVTSTASTLAVTEIVESIIEERFSCIQQRLQEVEAEVKKLPARLM